MGAMIGSSASQSRPEWAERIGLYPVGQSDPFADEIHRLQSVRLTPEEMETIRSEFPEWEVHPGLLNDFFSVCYQSLQLKFDAKEFESRGQFLFDRDLVPHEVDPDCLTQSSNRTYLLHVDRYADPRWEGNFQGAILLVPGTGSYGGNYIKFAQAMASLKGYIVYVIDPIYHGRSHGHKIVKKAIGAKGIAVSLPHAISEEGDWSFDAAFEEGWEETEPAILDVSHFVTNVQAVGRRIAQREAENLAHLNDPILSLQPASRPQGWFGKSANQLTHVTLIGTSQGGETAFWASDPRVTGQGAQAAYGILYPFDSVICHNVYNSAYTAPRSKMRLLRSGVMGGFASWWVSDKDSLWQATDWSDYYDGVALFLRAADRWVRWRYEMNSYQNLLRYGIAHRKTLPHMRIPLLVAVGKNDLLYDSDHQARKTIQDLFGRLKRDAMEWETMKALEYQTPQGTNGHQLLVHHTLPFMDMVDAWIRFRRAGPAGSFDYDPAIWKEIWKD
jgi:hypothetical protein